MLGHDVRHALRLLRREPGFTTAAILTLALGIGANVAVFALVNAALLRPLPYPDADRLLVLQHRDRRTGITKTFVALGDFVDIRARQRSFESLAGFGTGPATVYTAQEPFDVNVLQATPDLFEVLRVRVQLGRALRAEDGREGAAPAVVIGHDVWQERFGGDPAIVGRSITIGSQACQVVGVVAAGFRFPAGTRTDIIEPMSMPAAAPANRKDGWTFAVGRLARGASRERALDDLTTISRQMEREYRDQNHGSEYFALTVRDWMAGDTKQPLMLLLAAVSLVLLIACVNVANLLLARAVGRRQEAALRVALGAGRPRLIAQWITESLVLAAIAGAVGIAVAAWTIPLLLRLAPVDANLPDPSSVGVDGLVLSFAAAISALTAIVFGGIPAFGIRTDRAAAALVNPGRVTAGAGARRATAALVVLETALAIMLLTGAGLVLRSFARLLAVDPGFTPARVLAFDIQLPQDRYRSRGALTAFFARAFGALRETSGIESAGAATVTPLTGNNWTVPFERADRPVPAGERPPDVGWQLASGGFFTALKIPLRAGRVFNETDRPDGPHVVIVSEAIQQRYFSGENPVGRRLKISDGDAEIVGVVGNIRRAALTDEPRADLYFPFEQAPQAMTSLFVRTSRDPMERLAAVRAALRAIEPQIVLRQIHSMDEIARASAQTEQLALWMLGVFAACALVLAAVGIYAVMAYSVRQRTREIGTRVALGATSRDILWLVMRDGVSIAAVGAAIGLGASLLGARALSTLLYDMSPSDPLTLVAATALLLTVASIACYMPARRATRVDAARTLTAQ